MINLNTMTNLIKSIRTAKAMAEQLQEAGIQSDEYLLYYGSMIDTLYELCGEHTGSVEESATWELIHSQTSDEECAAMFLPLVNGTAVRKA